jgi:hypothetical protein
MEPPDEIGRWLDNLSAEGAYLWPNTPVGNIQAEIWRRCGASDYNLKHPRCRTRLILDTLLEMVENSLLPEAFTCIDLFCGTGVVESLIGERLPLARLYGVDVNSYKEHTAAPPNVTFHQVGVQNLIVSTPPRVIDVAIMLNTWRGWDRSGAGLWLPQATEAWLHANCRYVFLTVTPEQFESLKGSGKWWGFYIGQGEDDSGMVGLFPTGPLE